MLARRVESRLTPPGASAYARHLEEEASRVWDQYPKAKSPLEAWYQIARRANWETFADVRQTFNRADPVGRFVVFDIGGNKSA
jgi:mRNA-degrading endonuclease HigB of HigAB toxin-antitoxin module